MRFIMGSVLELVVFKSGFLSLEYGRLLYSNAIKRWVHDSKNDVWHKLLWKYNFISQHLLKFFFQLYKNWKMSSLKSLKKIELFQEPYGMVSKNGVVYVCSSIYFILSYLSFIVPKTRLSDCLPNKIWSF